MSTAKVWIESLQLRPHPEGGWFSELYKSSESIAANCLPERFGSDRTFCTAIYFLLDQFEFSALHRFQQDELWHFYDGSAVTIHVIDVEGNATQKVLGRDMGNGESLSHVVPAGSLFGATVNDTSSFALVGCTVAPGFEFEDFELPQRTDLIEQYPQHSELIERLTRV